MDTLDYVVAAAPHLYGELRYDEHKFDGTVFDDLAEQGSGVDGIRETCPETAR